MFEDEAGEVPRRHHIGEYNQRAVLCTFLLAWRGGLVIAVELTMVFVVALADDEHDCWRAERATVNGDMLSCLCQLGELLACQMVGKETERHAIDGQVEISGVASRQVVFHVTNGVVTKQP